MSYEQAQDKYIELMKYLLDNYEGYDPVYEDYDEFKAKMSKSDEYLINTLTRALTYFKDNNSDIGRGAKPNISTYIEKSNMSSDSDNDEDKTDEINEDELREAKELINNSKSDFLNSKMNTNYDDIKAKFKIGERKQSTKNSFKNPQYITRYNNAMNAFADNFIKNDMTIGFNSNYIKPDYLDSVFKKRHPEWKIDQTDFDNDGFPDVRIYDDENRLRVVNGFYFNDDTEKDKLRKHYLANKDNTYKTYLDEKFNLKNKEREAKGLAPLVRGGDKAHKKHVKAFVKWIHNTIKPGIAMLNRHDKMLFDASGFDSRMESVVERFLVLPFILHALGYDNPRVKNIVFEQDKSSPLYKLRMGILRSKEIKDLYKEYGANIEASLEGIMKTYGDKFIITNKDENGKITTELNAQEVIDFITSYMNNTWKIPVDLFNVATGQK